MGKSAYIDINTGKVSDSGTHPVVFLQDGWTSVICDIREWMVKDPQDSVPPAFINITHDKLSFLGDSADAQLWHDKIMEALQNIQCNYFYLSVSGSQFSISLNPNATPCNATAVILSGPSDATARATCYGNIMGGKKVDDGDWNDKQKGGGGGGGGGGGPPSPSPPSLGGSSGSSGGSSSGGGDGGQGSGSGDDSGSGDGNSDGQGGECGSCDGSGMSGNGDGGSDQGNENGDGQGQGQGQGQGEGSGEGSGEGDSDGQGEGSGSGEGQGDGGEGQGSGESDVCGDCGGTGEETPVNAPPSEDSKSPVQEKASEQAQKDFGAQQEERSEKCQAAADEAEKQAQAGNPEEATDSACEAKECGNPNSQKDQDNMNRAQDAANDAIDKAESQGELSANQAQELREQLNEAQSSNQSDAQKMASEARQMAQEAQENQDSNKLQDAADKAQEAADQVDNHSDAASVSRSAGDIADIADSMGEEDISEDMQNLAEEMSQRSNDRRWGIKDQDTGEFLTDDQGKPIEYADQEDAQKDIDQLDNDALSAEPLPNRLDDAFNEANDDNSMDPYDNEVRQEFNDEYEKTMDELAEGQICTVINLDGVFNPQHEVFQELIDYATLMNPMLGGMMKQAKAVPVQIAVKREKDPIHLEVIDLTDLDADEAKAKQEEVTSLHPSAQIWGMDTNTKPPELPKWIAFTWNLPGTLDNSFGINSQVRVLEEFNDWVKVRPLTNSSGFMALLKSNLDCYPQETTEKTEIEELMDLPTMPTSPQELQKVLDEARLKRQRLKRQQQEVSSDAMVSVRVNILTGERKSFTKDDLLQGQGGRGWVTLQKQEDVFNDLLGLISLLDENGITYSILDQKVGPTKIKTDSAGLNMAIKLGKPLKIRDDTVGYL